MKKVDYTNGKELTIFHPTCHKTFGCEIENCNCFCHYQPPQIDWSKVEPTGQAERVK